MRSILKLLLILYTFTFCCFINAEDKINSADIHYNMIDLIPNADQSAAIAINENDQVLGVFRTRHSNYLFLWEENVPVQILDIRIHQDDLFSENEDEEEEDADNEGEGLKEEFLTYYINNNKQISGSYYVKDDHNFLRERSFIWDEISGFVDIGTLGGTSTSITYFNDNMQAIGYSGVPFEETGLPLPENTDPNFLLTIDEVDHAFFYDNGKMIDLEKLFMEEVGGEWETIILLDLNNRGEVVLLAAVNLDTPEMFFKSYLWDQKSFQQLLPEEAADTSIFVGRIDDLHNMIVASISAKGETEFFYINAVTGERYPLMDSFVSSFEDFDFSKWLLKNNMPIRIDATPSVFRKGSDGINYISNGENIRKLLIESLPFYDVKNEDYTHIKGQNSQGHIVGYARTIKEKSHAFIAIPQQ